MLDKLKRLDLTLKDVIVNFVFPVLALLVAGWLGSISFLHIDWLKLAEIGVVIFILLSWMRLKLKMRADGVKLREEYEDLKDASRQDVATTKEELAKSIHDVLPAWNSWTDGHAVAHEQQKKDIRKQFEALEDRLKANKAL